MSSRKGKASQYERRAARRQQLDAMEAEASGTRASMNLETGDGFTSVRQRNQETARRFLYDEDEVAPSQTTKKNSTMAANLFGNRGPSTEGVNLMDHETGIYTNEDRSILGRMGRFIFGDQVQQPGEHDAISADSEVYLGEQARASRSSSLLVRLRMLLCGSRQRVLICAIVFVGVFAVSIHSLGLFQQSISAEQKLRNENSARFNEILDIITLEGVTDMQAFLNYTSPQTRALRWVAYSDPARLEPEDPVLTQRYALAVFFYNSFMYFQKFAGTAQVIEKDEEEQFEGVPIVGWYIQDHWLTGKGICKWYGVSCPAKQIDGIEKTVYDENAPVLYLNLTKNYVWGELPNEFKALHSLERLDVSQNHLSGRFPSEVRRMTKLKFVKLHDNQMTGSLPPQIGFMQSAIEVDISKNQFSGSLPSELNRLSNIRYLDLSHNKFTNQIPLVRGMVDLRVLKLANNELTGTFPFSLAENREIREIYLEKNKLSGTIAPEMESVSKLRIFSVYDNQITGPFPNGIFRTNEELEEVMIHFNGLTGSIPTFAGRLTNLRVLQMHDNAFTGTFPKEWTQMSKLEILHLQNNKMHGKIPANVNSFPVLKELWLSHNEITGAIPPEFSQAPHLQQLYLDYNSLSGQIPPGLGQMSQLQTFRLEGNDVTGAVPNEVCTLTTFGLRYFSLDCVNKVTCPENCCNKCY